jgi:hypothetical protein
LRPDIFVICPKPFGKRVFDVLFFDFDILGAFNGKPQFGQVYALSLTECLHSGHVFNIE